MSTSPIPSATSDGLYWYIVPGRLPEPVLVNLARYGNRFKFFRGREQGWLRDGERLVGPVTPPVVEPAMTVGMVGVAKAKRTNAAQAYSERVEGMLTAAELFVARARNGDELVLSDVLAQKGKWMTFLVGVRASNGTWLSFDLREVAEIRWSGVHLERSARRVEVVRVVAEFIESREALAWSICEKASRIDGPA